MCVLSFPRLKTLVQKKHVCLNVWTYFHSWADVFLPPWACFASDGECSQFPVEQEKQEPGERTLLDCFILLCHVSTARLVMQKQRRLSSRKGRRKPDTPSPSSPQEPDQSGGLPARTHLAKMAWPASKPTLLPSHLTASEEKQQHNETSATHAGVGCGHRNGCISSGPFANKIKQGFTIFLPCTILALKGAKWWKWSNRKRKKDRLILIPRIFF